MFVTNWNPKPNCGFLFRQEEMVVNAFNLGATDFMSKPFSPNELIIRAKDYL
jgi:DNA-binding response OmpR family regulator